VLRLSFGAERTSMRRGPLSLHFKDFFRHFQREGLRYAWRYG